MHVDKQKGPRLGRPCNHQEPLQFFLNFSQDTRISKKQSPPYFSGYTHTYQKSHHTSPSFLLRKELGSSLESFFSNLRSTPQGPLFLSSLAEPEISLFIFHLLLSSLLSSSLTTKKWTCFNPYFSRVY